MKKKQEFFDFLSQFIRNPKIVGALTPSSPFVGKAIVKTIHQEGKQNRQILEIGAGSGAITKCLIDELNPGDHLDVVECVQDLAAKLKTLIDDSGKKEQITLYDTTIEEFQPQKKYDHIIAGLPLTFFPPETVKQFYEKIDELLEKDGLYSYYEYFALPQVRLLKYKLFSNKNPIDYNNLRAILEIKENYLKQKKVEKNIVWLNLTPMQIYHVKLKSPNIN